MSVRSLAATFVSASLLSAPATAQTRADTTRTDTLEAVVVSATRAPALRLTEPRRIDVVTAADLRRTAADDAPGALKRTAGVDVIEYPGALAGVGIRGFRPEFSGISPRTLTLVDGRPAGSANLATFNALGLERMEVLRGPASALYGASAMAGVVNLVPRRSQGALRGGARGAYGSFETSDVGAWAGGDLVPRVEFDADAAFFRRGADYRIGRGGFLGDAVDGERATRLFADGTRETVDEPGAGIVRRHTRQETRSGALRLAYRIDQGMRIEARGDGFWADGVETPGDLFFDTAQDGRKDLRRTGGELAVRGTRGRFAPLIRVYSTGERSGTWDVFAADPFVNFVSRSSSRGGQAQTAVAFGAHSLVAGVDAGTVRAESRRYRSADEEIGTYSPDSEVGTAAAFAEGRVAALGGRLHATLGGRLDRTTLRLLETPLRT
ncbi:TonB-dependent receptor plug domain-containing protein, partial [Longimicrobium sp.]|uniref:TonB-dependent receptor plug domain-containing protein n=1 Tax=Longimicrobium sp. TaxID=2029185 RepID=UPI002E362321